MRLKVHYEAKLVMDFDIDMTKPGILPEKNIRENVAAMTNDVKDILSDDFDFEFGTLDVIEICNNVEVIE